MALSIGELVGYVGLDTSKAESAADRLGGMFEGLGGQWGKVLGGIGAAGGLALGAALFDAVGNEVGSDKLAASLGKGSQAAEAYGEIAGKVYSNGFGAGLEDVNTAIGAVVSSIKGMRNASDADVQKMTEKAMTFADIMGVDVTRAAQVAGNMVSSGLAKNGGQAFDLLMKASQQVPVQLREDVMDATDEYGQFFNALGIGGPEAMGLLAKGAEKGMYGIDKAGDAIKEFTILSTDGSKSTLSAFESIGLNGQKMSNDLLAGGDRAKSAFDKTLDGILAIKDPTAQAGAALSLFGTPLEDLGTKNIPAFLQSLQGGEASLGKFAGSVDKAGATAYDNAAGNLSMFGRTLKTEFVEMVGGSVLPKLTELTGLLVSSLGPAFDTAGVAVKATAGFLEQHKTAAAALAIGIGALVAVTAAHGAVLAVTAAGGMVAWLKSTTLISTATKAWAAVQWVLNAALAANPVVLVGVALIALGVALTVAWKKSETFRAIVLGSWDAIKSGTSAVFGKIKEAVSKAFDFLKNVFLNFTGPGLIIKHWDTIKTATTVAWAAIKGGVSAAIGGVMGAVETLALLPGKVGGWFGRLKDSAVEKLQALLSWVAGFPGRILANLGNLGSLGSLLYNAGASVIQGLIDGIEAKVATLRSKLQAVTKLIPDWKGPASTDKKLLRKNGQLIMQGLVDGITDGTAGLKGVLQDVTEDLGKKRLAKVEKAIKKEYARGVELGKNRTKVAEALEVARGALEDAVKLRDDFTASLLPPSALDAAKADLAAVTQLRDQMFDSVKSSALAYGSLSSIKVDDGPLTSDAVVSQLQARLAGIKAFRTNMAKLLGMGLDKASYQQMLADGVEKAGAMAEVLTQDPAAVAAVADLSTQIQDAATGLASDGATSMHQAGVDTATALVTSLTNEQAALYEAGVVAAKATLAGLESQEATLLEKMSALGAAMAKALSDALNVPLASVTDGVDGIPLQGKGPSKGGKDKGKGGKDKGPKDKNGRNAPLIGTVNQQPGETADQLAERLWHKTRSRG